MRVVLVGTAYPLRGGIAHYIALLYRTLRKRGHAVSVLSFRRQYPSLLFPGKTQKDEGAELIPVDSHPVLDSINPVTWIRGCLWLKKAKPDIVYFKYWMPFFAPCYAVLAFALRFVLHVPAVFLCDNVVPHEKKIFDVWLTRVALRFPDSFIAQSESVLADLRGFKPDALVRLVPHPVYEIFPPPVPKAEARRRLGIRDGRVILFFGYIRDYKGLRYLLEAMPEIRERLPVRLVVCGEFYEGRSLALDIIGRLKIEESVSLHDRFIPNDRVGDYFCAADIVVLPYVSATQSGIVQIAYYYDRPVIATTVGGLPETVLDGRTGFLIPPENSKAIAEAALKFYRENRTSDFEKNIREEKTKYSWDRMAEAIEELAADFHGRKSKPGTRSSKPETRNPNLS